VAGSNLFSSWHHQTKERQCQIYNEIGFGSYEKIDIYIPPGCTVVGRESYVAELEQTT
jgi:hypothetical protein